LLREEKSSDSSAGVNGYFAVFQKSLFPSRFSFVFPVFFTFVFVSFLASVDAATIHRAVFG